MGHTGNLFTFTLKLDLDAKNSGTLEFKNFPSQEGVVPKSQVIEIPNPFHRRTGEVCALEWSSDGYVLAVGWTYGWGVFSVGGRCLASGFEVEDTLDESRHVVSSGQLSQDC